MGTNHLAMRPSARLFITLLAALSIVAAQMAVFAPSAQADGWTLNRLVILFEDGSHFDSLEDTNWTQGGGQGGDVFLDSDPDTALHISCSADLVDDPGEVFYDGETRTIVDFWVHSDNPGGGSPGDRSCTPMDEFPITVPPPTFDDPDCDSPDAAAINFSDTDDYEYVVAGTIAPGESVTVTAEATGDLDLIGTTSWEHTFALVEDCDDELVTAVDPAVDQSDECDVEGTYTIPDTDGVQYLLDDSPIEPGAYSGPANATITAAALEDYELTNPDFSYNLDVAAAEECDLAISLTKSAVAIDSDELIVGELVNLNGDKLYLVNGDNLNETHTITYEFEVTNTGDVTLFNVTLDDPMLGGQVTLEDTTLAPDATTTGTATYDLTDEDMDLSTLPNTATVTGEDEEGTEVSDTDVEEIGIVHVEGVVFEVDAAFNQICTDDLTLAVEITLDRDGSDDTFTYALNDGDHVTIDGDELTLDNLAVDDTIEVFADGGSLGSHTVTDDADCVEVLGVTETAAAEELPETGFNTAGLTGLGLLLAMIGAASLLFTRRRHEADAS